MKSKQTPWTHTGVTAEELTISFKGGGQLSTDVVVPSGTMCTKLEGGSSPWVVSDLNFLDDKKSMLYHDADHYGIRIPETKIVGIWDINSNVTSAASVRERLIAQRGDLPPNPRTPDFDKFAEQVKGRLVADRAKDLSDAELSRCLGSTVAASACLAVALRLVADGLTIEQLYEGYQAQADDVFNAMVQMGQDVSLDDAKALMEKFSPADHLAFLTAKTGTDALAVVKAVQERVALTVTETNPGRQQCDYVVRIYAPLPSYLTGLEDEEPDGEPENTPPRTTDPEMAWRLNSEEEAAQVLLQAVEKFPANEFRVDTLPPRAEKRKAHDTDPAP